MILIQNGLKFREYKYQQEEDLEREVVENSKLLFGKDTIFIDAKKKIEAKALGGSIPDGFLFDLSNKENPEFYIVEVELASHDFFKHIFPQITKFFGFFKNAINRTELVEKIFSIVNTDEGLKKQFKKEAEIYKFIKDVIEDSQNILLVIDGEKEELPAIMETYVDTWGKMVKLLVLEKFVNGDNYIFTINPDFENIEFGYVESVKKVEQTEDEYSEAFHLESVNDQVKEIYVKIKDGLLKENKNLIFNPKKYYISIVYNRNIAFFQFRKKKIRLVVMMPEEEVKAKVKKHTVVHLSDGVQRFWNGPSCEIIIDDVDYIDEIIHLLKSLLKENVSGNPKLNEE